MDGEVSIDSAQKSTQAPRLTSFVIDLPSATWQCESLAGFYDIELLYVILVHSANIRKPVSE